MNSEECPICLEPLQLGDIAILSCSKQHQFHYQCIGEWICNQRNKDFTCPLCMSEYVEISTIIPSIYKDTWEHLFISNVIQQKSNKSNKSYPLLLRQEKKPHRQSQRHYQRQRHRCTNNEELDECCCTIL